MYNITTEQIIKMMNDPLFTLGITLIGIWTLIWKGIALWKASQNQSKAWFVVLLIVNSMGILEILYIFLLSKKEFCCFGKKKNDQLPMNPPQQ